MVSWTEETEGGRRGGKRREGGRKEGRRYMVGMWGSPALSNPAERPFALCNNKRGWREGGGVKRGFTAIRKETDQVCIFL